MSRRARSIALACLLVAGAGTATAQETQLGADWRTQREDIAKTCGHLSGDTVIGCFQGIFTGNPIHVAVGNLPPQNGLAFGLAFVEHWTPNESWRLSWNADAVATFGGNWRGGAYMKAIHVPATSGVTPLPPGAPPPARVPSVSQRDVTVLSLFVQSISLSSVSYFGLGQDTSQDAISNFAERQTLLGGSVAYPLSQVRGLGWLRPVVIGAINERFIDVDSAARDDIPGIEEIYNDISTPGLTVQKPFIEFNEGIRMRPSAFSGHLHFNYLLRAQQYRTSEETGNSFNRYTGDFRHEIPIYTRQASSGARDLNGPNDCSVSADDLKCPPVSLSRNRSGAVNFRLFVSVSGDNDAVPFYLMPTLGGSDLNGEKLLPSFDDYRFRGPNILALQENVEHSIWGPFGAFVTFEQGKVSTTRSGLNFSDLAMSTTVGVSVRAGGFPLVNFSFSWGGGDTHIIGTADPSLLGGSSRPGLF